MTFTDLAKELHPMLKERGISLSFKGYVDTWRAYLAFETLGLEELLELARDLSLWAEYFENIAALIQHQALIMNNEERYYEGFRQTIPVMHSKFNQVDQHYHQCVARRQKLTLFHTELLQQRRAFYRGHQSLMMRFDYQQEELMRITFAS